jgi:hypothetical protein
MALTQIQMQMLVDGILSADAAGRAKMADGFLTLAKLSASGTPDATKFLRGDNSWAAVVQVVKKIHTFSYATRNVPNNTIQNVFSWTSSFTPIDKVNNNFLVISAVPIQSQTQDYSGFGLRFDNGAGGVLDTQGRGTQYAEMSANSLTMSIQQYAFNIAANELPTGTMTIYHRLYTTDSQATICPNSTDNGRINQTTASLFIIEYAN